MTSGSVVVDPWMVSFQDKDGFRDFIIQLDGENKLGYTFTTEEMKKLGRAIDEALLKARSEEASE
jgi:hypothetical protein